MEETANNANNSPHLCTSTSSSRILESLTPSCIPISTTPLCIPAPTPIPASSATHSCISALPLPNKLYGENAEQAEQSEQSNKNQKQFKRLEQQRSCQRKRRANLTEQELDREREKDKIRTKQTRTNLTEQELDREREQDKIRKEQTRTNLTEQELDREREQDRIRKRKTRANLTDQELNKEREQAQMRMKNSRKNMSQEEVNHVQYKDRTRKANSKVGEKQGKLYRKASYYSNVEFYELGPFDVECMHCGAVHFPEERSKYRSARLNEFTSCCNCGNFTNLLDLIDDYPDELKDYFMIENNKNKEFLKNIRKYNNSFACASFACNRFNFPTPGIQCFKISGQVYHKFNEIAETINNELPSNGQLYFVDSSDALTMRKQKNEELHIDLLKSIEQILRRIYPYAEAYEMMKNVMESHETNKNDIRMLLSLKTGFDPNRYNVQQSNEVAAIVVCNANEEIPPANIVVVPKGSKTLKNIYPLDKCVEPLIYPLLYPTGKHGWYINMKDKKGKNISFCDYTKFKLFYRKNKFLPHHHSGKLYQQWLVDQCARLEWSRLNYIRTHQKEIRSCNYKSITEYLTNKSENEGVEIGKQVILPSSFFGGPRNKEQNYIDSLAIVGETGKPDLFITYTCNPSDPDIIKCLHNGQTPDQRAEIIARVFKLKADKLIEEVVKDELFGRVIAFFWVIEFQKRGLPHLHFLVTLDPKDKLKNKDDIDKNVRAYLTLKDEDSEVRELVKKLMMHGPCGEIRPEAPCMRNGKCRFKFPKKFREETEMGENGYALHKRPNNGEYEYVKGAKLTNQNVAPYNAYLLKRFKSHINVEICSEINAIKYIYKYIYKGFDAATVECVKNGPNGEQILLKYDEISTYLEARYISPIEAAYRILKFDLHGKSHSIDRLDVHLENEQSIYFDKNASEETLEDAMNKNTKLIAYFNFFDQNPTAPKFRYIEMPKKCTFDTKNKIWKWPRKTHNNVIGRIHPVNPKNTELYYLRYLLIHKHAKSFEELRTVNGKIYEKYSQACLELGLTRDDEEWDKCIKEASNFRMPGALRSLFVTILLNCDVKNPGVLWENHKDALSEDLKRIFTVNDAYDRTLCIINAKLEKQEKCLNDYNGIPIPITKKFADCNIYNPKDELDLANKQFNTMNEDQKVIFNEIKNTIENPKMNNGYCFYIDGPGGTGKSYVQHTIYHFATGKHKKVCNMAYSGIAATMLIKGRTVHNRFKLPLDIDLNSFSSIEIQTKEAKEIEETDIFIWDEAPMASRFMLECVDKKLKEICKNDIPFGGKVIIASGDFRQVSPIKKKATRSELVELSIRNSDLWKYFKVMNLTENMRKDENANEFAQELIKIGNGEGKYAEFIPVPKMCDIGENDLVDEIFGDIIQTKDFSRLSTHCILAPYNRDVDLYNEKVLEKFPDDNMIFHSIDETEGNTNFQVLPELLNKLDCSSLPKHELKLKNNCIVMLLRNLDIEQGLCNGTRMQILDVCKNVLRCLIINGNRTGEIIFIPRITLIEEKNFSITLKRHQFPIRLAFAMSINKSQAQTLEKIGLDLCRDVFAHGQAYVGISRTRSWERIKIKLSPENVDRRVKNIVWKELLDK